MASRGRPSRGGAPRGETRPQLRRLPWGAPRLAVLTPALLVTIGDGGLSSLVAALFAARGQGPSSQTIVHSSDTWGFVFPCG